MVYGGGWITSGAQLTCVTDECFERDAFVFLCGWYGGSKKVLKVRSRFETQDAFATSLTRALSANNELSNRKFMGEI